MTTFLIHTTIYTYQLQYFDFNFFPKASQLSKNFFVCFYKCVTTYQGRGRFKELFLALSHTHPHNHMVLGSCRRMLIMTAHPLVFPQSPHVRPMLSGRRIGLSSCSIRAATRLKVFVLATLNHSTSEDSTANRTQDPSHHKFSKELSCTHIM